MDKSVMHIEECTAYPGKYVPMPDIEELLNDQPGSSMTQPPLNIDEFDNFFRIEVSLPGIHKQDIVVLVEDRILTVKVIHKDADSNASKPRIHEFDINYFERPISLPEDADIEFTSAEYRDGVLSLLVPKVATHSKVHPGRIVVY